jgi:hypothetical protein
MTHNWKIKKQNFFCLQSKNFPPDKRHPGHRSRYGKYGPRSGYGFLRTNQSQFWEPSKHGYIYLLVCTVDRFFLGKFQLTSFVALVHRGVARVEGCNPPPPIKHVKENLSRKNCTFVRG